MYGRRPNPLLLTGIGYYMANQKQKNNSRLIAFSGIMAALSLVLMLLTAVIPIMDYGLPAICGILTTLVVIECGERMAGVCYGAVAILSLVLVPSKESAILYLILLGWYPIVKRRIEMLRKPVAEWALKIICMAVPVGIASGISVYLLGVEGFFGEYLSPAAIGAFYLAAAAAFVIYDLALTKLISAYISVIRPRYIAKLLR